MNDIIQESGLPATLNAGNVESVADNSVYKYTANEMVALSGGGRRTFDSWCTEVFATVTECGSKYRTKVVEGKARYYLYTEEALKAFQQWRMKNQANQGRASQAVKDATYNAISLGNLTLAAIENDKAWEELNNFRNAYVATKRNEQALIAENKLLIAENKELDNRHTEAVEYIIKHDNLSKYTYVGAETLKKMIKERVIVDMGIKDWKCPPMTVIARKMNIMKGKGATIECVDTRYVTHWENKEHNNRLETVYNTHYLDEFVGTALTLVPVSNKA